MAFTRDGVIHASPERVFSVISDLDQTRQWMPAIERIDVVTPGPFRQGTVWRETRNAGKRTLESTIRVTGLEKPSRLDLEVESRPMKGQISFRLTPKEESTAVHYEAQMQGRGLMRLMSGMMNRMMAEADNRIASANPVITALAISDRKNAETSPTFVPHHLTATTATQ